MANRVSECGIPRLIAANGNVTVAAGSMILSFICTTGGSIAIADAANNSLLAATTVTAGGFLPILFECPIGATVTLSGGAAGTLVVG